MAAKAKRTHGRKGAEAPLLPRDVSMLLKFARVDLDTLSLGQRFDWRVWALQFATGRTAERVVTSNGRSFSTGEVDGVIYTNRSAIAEEYEFFSDETLRRAQASLVECLEHLRSKEGWSVPRAGQRRIGFSNDGTPVISYEGSEHGTFLERAVDALVAHWRLVRLCARRGCPNLFVASGRRRYCTTSCSQKAQWARFLTKHPTRDRDYQAEYDARIRKRHGRNVKATRQARRGKLR